MHPHNDPQYGQPGTNVAKVFKRKDGLFEYTKNVLEGTERQKALQRLAKSLPELSAEVKEFLKLPASDASGTERQAARGREDFSDR